MQQIVISGDGGFFYFLLVGIVVGGFVQQLCVRQDVGHHIVEALLRGRDGIVLTGTLFSLCSNLIVRLICKALAFDFADDRRGPVQHRL